MKTTAKNTEQERPTVSFDNLMRGVLAVPPEPKVAKRRGVVKPGTTGR
jgi:hypothetical protein